MAGGLATVYALTSAIGAGSQLAGGMSAMSASNKEAGALQRQGGLAFAEAKTAAAQRAEEVRHFQADQKERYLASGVTLEGSPLIVLEDTRRKGQAEVNAMLQRGREVQKMYGAQAQQARRAGRSAFLSGLLGAVGTGASAYMAFQNPYLFGSAPGAQNRMPASGHSLGGGLFS